MLSRKPGMAAQRYRIAVIGAGAAGLTAAYLLERRHEVTLYEKGHSLGGHAHTIVLDRGPDAGTPLDVGFMVLNRRNYPTMYRLLAQLPGVQTYDCEMSFAYYSPAEGAGYVVNRSRPGNPSSAREETGVRDLLPALLPEILRFCHQAVRDLESEALAEVSLGDYLGWHRISAECVRRYVVAMGAAIWSTPPWEMLAFPAQSYLRFLNNHGMLCQDPPQWQYIKGGSRRYVEAMAGQLCGPVHLGADVEWVVRDPDGVLVRVRGSAAQKYDLVVLGVHGDQALRLLAEPTELERWALAAWKYQLNSGYLHSDASVMPPDRRLWASWNYQEAPNGRRTDLLQVSYHLNRLQGHGDTKHQYFVTLNPTRAIAEESIVRPLSFTHPTFSLAAMRGRDELLSHNGENRTYFCGSYCGYGFHEDAIKSGAAVAAALGVEL
jgi:predicted NAD/FAD-binding protein